MQSFVDENGRPFIIMRGEDALVALPHSAPVIAPALSFFFPRVLFGWLTLTSVGREEGGAAQRPCGTQGKGR